MNTTQTSETASETPEVSTVTIEPKYKLEKITAISKANLRENISNIKLDSTKRFGECAVATNGRSLAVVPIKIEQGANDKGLISPEALQASRKNKPFAGMLKLDGTIELPASVKFPRPTQSDSGNYPRWETILPDKPAKFSIGLNPRLLWELAQAIGCDSGGDIMRLDIIDEMSPITVTHRSSRANGEYGLLMPGRI